LPFSLSSSTPLVISLTLFLFPPPLLFSTHSSPVMC
jgi:hypothetical protein